MKKSMLIAFVIASVFCAKAYNVVNGIDCGNETENGMIHRPFITKMEMKDAEACKYESVDIRKPLSTDTPIFTPRLFKASEKSETRLDSTVCYLPNDIYKYSYTYYYYRDNGELYRRYIKEFNGNKPTYITEETFTNDDMGRVICIYQKSYSENTPENYMLNKTERSFNDDDLCTYYAYYRYNKDTGTWYGTGQRYIYDYNAAGETILKECYEWSDESKDWVGTYKITRGFDENGKINLYAEYLWSKENNDWKSSYMEKGEYNDEGNFNCIAYYKWDDTQNDWFKIIMVDFTYNGESWEMIQTEYSDKTGAFENTWRITLQNEFPFSTKTQYEWKSANNDWQPTAEEFTVYNSDGTEKSFTYSEWSSKYSRLVVSYKSVYTYNGLGQRIMSEFYRQLNARGDLYLEDSSVYSYDERGNRILTMSTSYYTDGAVFLSRKTEEGYNDNNVQTLYAVYLFSTKTNEYELQKIQRYEYNEDGQTTYYENSNYLVPGFFGSSDGDKYIYEYDAYGNLIHELSYRFNDYTNNEWCLIIEITNYYSIKQDNGIKSVHGFNEFKVEGDEIVLEAPTEVTLYDTNGRLIYSGYTDRVRMPYDALFLLRTIKGSAKVYKKM